MSRYTPDELERWLFVETIADPAEPSPTELGTGVNLRPGIASISGFTFTVSTVEAPDMDSRFTKTVAGRSSVEASSMEFYAGDDEDDPEVEIRAALPRNANGFIVRVPPVEGAQAPLTAGTDCEVWPVEVTGNNRNTSAPGEVAKVTVTYSHPDVPRQDAVITT